ncbi:non-ribosomal peptide synthetase condensation domain protein [Nonomuraea sp. NN258]|uniref:condensation domain-containing protein n=1 Tax=Nonomuraea antri TaxID=2730852 RepID=UPI00156A178B|nr:condensation domain-containing protein [Nonomuraea antri]NRQ32587.1 non-ribosomal peptide synthetase condensation domain protein [Nonomuraea antri]
MTVFAEFRAADAGTGPLTWGQRAIWQTIERTAPDDHYFNFGNVLPVPKGAGAMRPGRVMELVAALVERHASLRTRLGLGTGEPWQRLEQNGRLAATVVAAAPGQGAAVAERLRDELAATVFDYEKEWPLRVGLVTGDDPASGAVTHVVLVFCHLAADGHGAEIALRDLRMSLLRGALTGPPAPRPLELAEWQRGTEGRTVAANAAAYWNACARTEMFADRANEPDGPPIWRAELASTAVDLAVRTLAARHATGTSSVLLAAVATMTGRFTGRGECVLLPIVNNRFRADTARIVSTLSQEGLFRLDVAGPFEQVLRASGAAALRSYRSAYHDPADRVAGDWVQPWCCYNDMRFADPGPSAHEARQVRDALADTRLTWPLSQDKLNCRFCLHVSAAEPGLRISLTADTAYLARQDMERYLLELEALLVDAACQA